MAATPTGVRIMEQLREVQRAANQIGETWPIIHSQEYIGFTAGSPPTGSIALPTGIRNFSVVNKTNAYLILSFDGSDATPTNGGSLVKSLDEKFYGLRSGLSCSTYIATTIGGAGTPTMQVPIYIPAVSFALATANVLSREFSDTGGYTDGGLFVTYYKP